MISASAERDSQEFRSQMLQKGAKTVLQYWLVDGKGFPLLRQVALKVFGIVASSAASERNFSTMGFVHSKLRNSLKEGSVK